ncbi:MerR family transcriptional regulator [Bacillaceae bacterium Marseille-Q3522]|nr:MerR family transcriptional regulator [Bacillaceae bacterium Marseille-Q3522]
MRIGEFLKKVDTTKDTVRHYEDIKLLDPEWKDGRREYAEQQINDFHAIREMKSLGLKLKDIREIFNWKRQNGCGSKELIDRVSQTLDQELKKIHQQEAELQNKKKMINELLVELQKLK